MPLSLACMALMFDTARFAEEIALGAGGTSLLLLTAEIFRSRPSERSALAAVLKIAVLSGIAWAIARFIPDQSFHTAHHAAHLIWKLLLAAALVKYAGVLIFGAALPLLRFSQPRIVRDLAVAATLIGTALDILAYEGMSVSGVITTSAVLTAVIGFSLQDTLGNIMSGIALQLDETLNVGDWIQLEKYTGRVTEIAWRHTAIETRDSDTVFIPNSKLMKEEVTVLGRRIGHPVQHRQWVYFNVDFRTAPSEVIATVERALAKSPIENVAIDPPANCVAMGLEDSAIKFAVRYWLTDLMRDDYTNSLVRSRIYAALSRADIHLSIPAQTLFVKQQNRSELAAHEQRELDRRVIALKNVDVFKALTDDEFQHLAARLHSAPFAKGEVIMKQGETAHWLYILTSGKAVEETFDQAGGEHLVTQLDPGDVFGEMSLLTGAPRSATVIASNNVTTYRLDPDGFRDIIHARPEIGTSMSQILATRKAAIDQALHHTDKASAQEVSSLSQELLSRIYSFFNLGTKAQSISN